MRGYGRVGWTAVVAAAFVLHAGAASAATSTKNETLVASGSLTYTWQGDPTRGCAAMGLCGVKGQLIITPQAGAQTVTTGGPGPASIFIGASGVVRVIGAGPSSGECVDSTDQTFSGFELRLLSPHRATATLQTPPASGRCAGPLPGDLAGISFPVRATGGRRPSFAMRGARQFVAGPFSGSAVAAIRLTPVPSNQGSGFSGNFFSSSGPAHVNVEAVQLAYHVSTTSDTIQTVFNGASDSSCQIVESCGASGLLRLSAAPSGAFSIFGYRNVRRRRSKGQALADLRRGDLSMNGYANAAGEVTESYTWSDGSSCHDSVSTPLLNLAVGLPGAGAAGARIPVALTSSGQGPGTEMLRTHCPGPSDSDLFGQGQNQIVLASGFLSAGQLLSKHISLELTAPSSFIGLGYTGNRQGSIALELTLSKVNVTSQ